jgi:HSP20 family molecular chaperone IbpA
MRKSGPRRSRLFRDLRRALENYIAEHPGVSVPLNKSRSVGYHQRFVTALPGINFEVLHVLADGDHVLIHWRESGTHAERLATVTGETIPPTRRRVTVPGAMLTEVRDGKIARVVLLGSALHLVPHLLTIPRSGSGLCWPSVVLAE